MLDPTSNSRIEVVDSRSVTRRNRLSKISAHHRLLIQQEKQRDSELTAHHLRFSTGPPTPHRPLPTIPPPSPYLRPSNVHGNLVAHYDDSIHPLPTTPPPTTIDDYRHFSNPPSNTFHEFDFEHLRIPPGHFSSHIPRHSFLDGHPDRGISGPDGSRIDPRLPNKSPSSPTGVNGYVDGPSPQTGAGGANLTPSQRFASNSPYNSRNVSSSAVSTSTNGPPTSAPPNAPLPPPPPSKSGQALPALPHGVRDAGTVQQNGGSSRDDYGYQSSADMYSTGAGGQRLARPDTSTSKSSSSSTAPSTSTLNSRSDSNSTAESGKTKKKLFGFGGNGKENERERERERNDDKDVRADRLQKQRPSDHPTSPTSPAQPSQNPSMTRSISGAYNLDQPEPSTFRDPTRPPRQGRPTSTLLLEEDVRGSTVPTNVVTTGAPHTNGLSLGPDRSLPPTPRTPEMSGPMTPPNRALQQQQQHQEARGNPIALQTPERIVIDDVRDNTRSPPFFRPDAVSSPETIVAPGPFPTGLGIVDETGTKVDVVPHLHQGASGDGKVSSPDRRQSLIPEQPSRTSTQTTEQMAKPTPLIEVKRPAPISVPPPSGGGHQSPFRSTGYSPLAAFLGQTRPASNEPGSKSPKSPKFPQSGGGAAASPPVSPSLSAFPNSSSKGGGSRFSALFGSGSKSGKVSPTGSRSPQRTTFEVNTTEAKQQTTLPPDSATLRSPAQIPSQTKEPPTVAIINAEIATNPNTRNAASPAENIHPSAPSAQASSGHIKSTPSPAENLAIRRGPLPDQTKGSDAQFPGSSRQDRPVSMAALPPQGPPPQPPSSRDVSNPRVQNETESDPVRARPLPHGPPTTQPSQQTQPAPVNVESRIPTASKTQISTGPNAQALPTAQAQPDPRSRVLPVPPPSSGQSTAPVPQLQSRVQLNGRSSETRPRSFVESENTMSHSVSSTNVSEEGWRSRTDTEISSPITDDSHSRGSFSKPASARASQVVPENMPEGRRVEEPIPEAVDEPQQLPPPRQIRPRVELALTVFPQSILTNLLRYLDYLEFRPLCELSRIMRRAFSEGEAKEVILERYLGDVGYRRVPLPRGLILGKSVSTYNGGNPQKRTSNVPRTGSSSGSQGRFGVSSGSHVAKAEVINISLRDMDAFQAGASFSPNDYALCAKAHKSSPLDVLTLRMIRASTRAWNRILLRVRSQPAILAEASRRSTIGPGQKIGTVRRPATPMLKPGRAPVLRVWVPTKQSWMTDEELVECEREIWRSGVWAHLQRGDVVWNVAVGDFANEGKLIFDSKYLRDLAYTYDHIGHLPAWINLFAFPPSFYHNTIVASGANPTCFLDLTPFLAQVQQSLALCQDKVEVASPQGRYRVCKYVYRASVKVSPGTIIGGSGGVGGSGPGGIEVIHDDWGGQLVIETEGTTEHAQSLLRLCTPPPPPQSFSRYQQPAKPQNGIAVLSPWRILRERSRPGKLWIRPVFDDEKVA